MVKKNLTIKRTRIKSKKQENQMRVKWKENSNSIDYLR
jgi:hypothetical protein